MTDIATKIAEEVFLTIERNGRLVKDDIAAAVVKMLALEKREAPVRAIDAALLEFEKSKAAKSKAAALLAAEATSVPPTVDVARARARAVLDAVLYVIRGDTVEAKLLTATEFEALMQDRCPRASYKEYFFKLAHWENRPDEVAVIWSDPFAVFEERNETSRKVNGDLPQPPRLYVVYYDDEMDAICMITQDWRAAKFLKPDIMRAVCDMLGRFRNERDAAKIVAEGKP